MTDTETSLDALATSWERRAEELRRNYKPDEIAMEAITLEACSEKLRAYLESASSQSVNAELPAVRSTAWLEWLRGKLAEVERSIAAREQAAKCWKGGTNKSWAESAKMHPDTVNLPPLTKAARMATAGREERIVVKLRQDAANYRAVIEALSHSNQ